MFNHIAQYLSKLTAKKKCVFFKKNVKGVN